MDTKESEEMLKRILILEEERVPARDARGREIEGQKSRVTREDYKRSREEFEVEGFMAQRGSWHIAKKRMLEDRGALPEKTETCSVNAKPCTKNTFAAVGCGRMWKEKKRKWRGLRRKLNKKKVSVKREVEGEREKI